MSSISVFRVLPVLFLTTVTIPLICDGADTGRTPAFFPWETYRDIFPLTAGNFSSKVLGMKDPWIVIFHDGTMEKAWKTMATHLRGLCWVGMVDNRTETGLLRDIGYDPDTETDARVYLYGHRTKGTKWRSARNANEARAYAMSSLPDVTQRLKVKDVNDFLTESFMAVPSKFPVYLLTDEDETGAMIKALALRLEKYFSFGVILRPTADDIQLLGLEHFFYINQELFVLVKDHDSHDEEYKFSAIRFDKDRMGAMNYTNVMQFMFAVNTQFRYALPGENQSNQKQEAEMEDVMKIEQERFQLLYHKSHESDEHVHEFENDVHVEGIITRRAESRAGKDEL